MKRCKLFFIATLLGMTTQAQLRDGGDDDKRPFQQNLFTGGSVSLSFFGNTFLVGGSPVLGYSVTNWLDAGMVVNATYASYRDYNGVLNDKLRQTLLGGGGFLRLYPVRFLFVQGQLERNSIQQTFIPIAGVTEKYSVGASILGSG